jgi:hypothetical protein
MTWAGLSRAEVTDAGVVDEIVVKVAPGKGLTVSRGEALSMNVRARVQLRDAVTIEPKTLSNELALRTARLVISGKVLHPKFQYSLQLALAPNDFETGNPSPVFDAWVEYVGWRDVQVRVGQFFVPFDRARTIREFALQLVDRPQVVSELTLDRDMGVVLSSSDLFGLGGRLGYSLGFFSGQGKNRVTPEKNPGFLYLARLSFKPMGAFDDDVEGDLERSATPHLALGAAVAFNQDTARQKSTTGAVLTLGGFDQLHVAGDLVFKWRGVSLLAEVVLRQANAPFHENETTREYSRSAWGYLVQAGWLVHPHVEVAARWDQLRFIAGDPALEAQIRTQGREVGAGVNVYLNGHLAKVQADWALRFGEPGSTPTHFARLAVDVSF